MFILRNTDCWYFVWHITANVKPSNAHTTLNNQRKPEKVYFCFLLCFAFNDSQIMSHNLLFHTVLMYSCVCVVPLIHILLRQNAIITIHIFVTYFLVFVHLISVQCTKAISITKNVMYICLPHNGVNSSRVSNISTDDYDPIKLSKFPPKWMRLECFNRHFVFLFLFSFRKCENWIGIRNKLNLLCYVQIISGDIERTTQKYKKCVINCDDSELEREKLSNVMEFEIISVSTNPQQEIKNYYNYLLQLNGHTYT